MSIETLPDKVPGVDYGDRWSAGRHDHHPKSIALMRRLCEIDLHLFGDYFCWKHGGDGDNGDEASNAEYHERRRWVVRGNRGRQKQQHDFWIRCGRPIADHEDPREGRRSRQDLWLRGGR